MYIHLTSILFTTPQRCLMSNDWGGPHCSVSSLSCLWNQFEAVLWHSCILLEEPLADHGILAMIKWPSHHNYPPEMLTQGRYGPWIHVLFWLCSLQPQQKCSSITPDLVFLVFQSGLPLNDRNLTWSCDVVLEVSRGVHCNTVCCTVCKVVIWVTVAFVSAPTSVTIPL